MTVSVTLIDINTQNFEALVDKVNEVANLVSNSAVTANTTQGLTTGNVYVDGIFSVTTLSANTELRGGNVTSAAVLTIGSNVSVSTGNTLTIGNSTVNTAITETSVTVATLTGNVAGSLSVGTTVVNSTVVSADSLVGPLTGNVSGSLSTGTTSVNATAIDVDTLTVGVSVATSNLSATNVIDFGGSTDAIELPQGTTAQRPGTPATGMIRYNSTESHYEAYISGAWQQIVLASDQLKVFDDDGTTQLFP